MECTYPHVHSALHSEFVAEYEIQTGRAGLHAVLRAPFEVTMYKPAAIMCESEKVLITLETYDTHVTIHHVPSRAGLQETEVVDQLANQGRPRSPLTVR